MSGKETACFDQSKWITLWSIAATLLHIVMGEDTAGASDATYDILMPGAKPKSHDAYLCTSFPVQDSEAYIYKFEALANADTAHHMLMYGCDGEPYSSEPIWNCPLMCKRSSPTIMFAWAKNAPPTVLPEDVGLRIGKNTNLKTIVLQVHYAKKFEDDEDPDHSGLRIYTTYKQQPYMAGIFLLMSTWFSIPPHEPSYPVDISCHYTRDMTMVPFAYRTHAHGLGTVITGYKYVNGVYTEIGKGNPQWPQAFYPVKDPTLQIHRGDYLAARCTYDSTSMSKNVRVGATGDDEMCNFYIMFYTNSSKLSPYGDCANDREPSLTGENFPANVSVPLPSNPALEDLASGHHHHGGMGADDDADDDGGDDNEEAADGGDTNVGTTSKVQTSLPTSSPDIHFQHSLVFNASWPGHPMQLGQIGGIASDKEGRVYIFHRASRIWDVQSFSLDNDFLYQDFPINEDVLVILDKEGRVLRTMGAGQFFMPHGIEVDHEGNAWLTDVAMHQVIKLPLAAYLADPSASEEPKPSLVLGKRFRHGTDDDLFCKPTDVAVLSTGEFFVSDGYCNSRVLKFTKDGRLIKKWGINDFSSRMQAPSGAFNVPHGVTVAEDSQTMCVADRENGRIQCFDLDGNFMQVIKHAEFGPRIYGVEYCPQHGGVLYAINGPGYDGQHAFTVQGFTLDIKTGELLEMWNTPQQLKSPHDVCVDPSSHSVYVGELDPRSVWKLSRTEPSQTTVSDHDDDDDHAKPGDEDGGLDNMPDQDKKGDETGVTDTDNNENPVNGTSGINSAATGKKSDKGSDTSYGGMTPSMIIGLLLVVPVILILIIVLVVRAHKAGHLQKKGKIFSLQGILGNSHKGFDPLSTEESDHELDPDDSDHDEYLAPKKFKTKP